MKNPTKLSNSLVGIPSFLPISFNFLELNEKTRLQKALLQSHLNTLIKKKKILVKKEHGKNIYINPKVIEPPIPKIQLKDVYCDIQNEVYRQYPITKDNYYPIKYARKIAYDKYKIEYHSFDSQLERLIKNEAEDWRNSSHQDFDLGHGMSSGLTESDAFRMQGYDGFPDYYFYIKKRCKK